MAITSFVDLAPEEKVLWADQTDLEASNRSIVAQWSSKGANSVIQVYDDFKSQWGSKIKVHLLNRLTEDGGIGDNQRLGNEERAEISYDDMLFDMIFHSVREKGKLSNKKSVIQLAEHASQLLGEWLADRVDQLFFLTGAGIGYQYNVDGSLRSADQKNDWPNLAFAADVAALTAKRHLRATFNTTTGKGGIATDGLTTGIVATDRLTYDCVLNVATYMNRHYIKPIMMEGKPYYVWFLSPEGRQQLWEDENLVRAMITAMPRSNDNPFFSGATFAIHGMMFVDHRLVYTTLGAASGSKWGAGGTVDGSRSLVCGAQAMAMLDCGAPTFETEALDFKKAMAFNIDKFIGFKRTKHFSTWDRTTETFGMVGVDHAI